MWYDIVLVSLLAMVVFIILGTIFAIVKNKNTKRMFNCSGISFLVFLFSFVMIEPIMLPEKIELDETVERASVDKMNISDSEWISVNEVPLRDLQINDAVTASAKVIESEKYMLLIEVPIGQSGDVEPYIISHNSDFEYEIDTSVVVNGLYAGTDKTSRLPVINAVRLESR